MLKFVRTNRRFIPAVLSCVALFVAVAFSALGGSSSGSSDTTTSQLAAARSADATANRGSARTAETTTSTTEATTTTTVVPETTTTVAPTTTTVKPTTTTAKPKPAVAVAAAAAPSNSQSGGASYYAQPWAAKGCAHKTLPKGTVVTVTNLANGKSTTCVVNDRGPYISGRIIDLDTTIFKQVASTSSGVFQAKITW